MVKQDIAKSTPNKTIPGREELINDLKRVAASLKSDSYIFREYMNNGGKYIKADFVPPFRDWNEAMKEAGLIANRINKKLSREDILNDIRRVAKELNTDRLSWHDYKSYPGECPDKNIVSCFGTWGKALKEACLNEIISENTITKRDSLTDEEKATGGEAARKEKIKPFATNDELLDDLKRVSEFINSKYITEYIYKSNSGKYSSFSYSKMFGSWRNAVLEAGLIPGKKGASSKPTKKAPLIPTTGSERFSKAEMLEDLKRVAENMNVKYISYMDYKNNSGKFQHRNFKKKFGSWPEALTQAGLDTKLIYTNLEKNDLQELKELIADLKKVIWASDSRDFTFAIYKLFSNKYPLEMFIKYFVTWKNALREAGRE